MEGGGAFLWSWYSERDFSFTANLMVLTRTQSPWNWSENRQWEPKRILKGEATACLKLCLRPYQHTGRWFFFKLPHSCVRVQQRVAFSTFTFHDRLNLYLALGKKIIYIYTFWPVTSLVLKKCAFRVSDLCLHHDRIHHVSTTKNKRPEQKPKSIRNELKEKGRNSLNTIAYIYCISFNRMKWKKRAHINITWLVSEIILHSKIYIYLYIYYV